jgi:hypothetical protein
MRNRIILMHTKQFHKFNFQKQNKLCKEEEEKKNQKEDPTNEAIKINDHLNLVIFK